MTVPSPALLVLQNRQKVLRVDLRLLRRLTKHLLEQELHLASYELCVHLVSASEITRLNEQFLQHAGPTDVIAFDQRGAANLINTPLQRGAPRRKRTENRFNGFSPTPETVETVYTSAAPHVTPLKRGVNERSLVCPADDGEAPHPALQGELFICLEVAVTQAQQFRTTWTSELARYIIHGLLHLSGYDDLSPGPRRVMKREENRLLRAASKSFPLVRLRRSLSR